MYNYVHTQKKEVNCISHSNYSQSEVYEYTSDDRNIDVKYRAECWHVTITIFCDKYMSIMFDSSSFISVCTNIF